MELENQRNLNQQIQLHTPSPSQKADPLSHNHIPNDSGKSIY